MLTIDEIVKATGGQLIQGNLELTAAGISIDSRNIKDGELFIAIKGDVFDGHNFIEEAIKKGACGAIVNGDYPLSGSIPQDRIILSVSDTILALQETARFYRNKFTIPVTGITGSNGKTTTKEMLWSILSQKSHVLKNEGNLNNHIGVPLTLLRLDSSYKTAIIEMGISDRGELSRLCYIASPDSAVITNIGPTHLEKLGRIENVAEAKGEILKFIPSNGFCILNRDDKFFDVFKAMSAGRIISFGISPDADVHIESYETVAQGKSADSISFNLICPAGRIDIKLHAIGIHNIYNALSAAAAAYAHGIAITDIKSGLERFSPVRMRSAVEKVGEIYIINDTYNANPASMVAAIDMLKNFKAGNRRFAVIGDMLELGENTIMAHRDLGIYIAGAGTDGLISVGEFAGYVAEGAVEAGMSENNVKAFNDYPHTLEQIKEWITTGDIVLVKGSRGMKMERIVEGLRESLNK
ncbi:MAG: UDP-N-acetylmuramoyl-tripeptide--D-alanyl-D-alanine ligase [Nitrospirae bacterium]|nr:UDP-N-acetylmuramoyl-tripeptide--D-alanyl-D-alanine ligase [Nitrospirota bacterium]